MACMVYHKSRDLPLPLVAVLRHNFLKNNIVLVSIYYLCSKLAPIKWSYLSQKASMSLVFSQLLFLKFFTFISFIYSLYIKAGMHFVLNFLSAFLKYISFPLV